VRRGEKNGAARKTARREKRRGEKNGAATHGRASLRVAVVRGVKCE
jgi:hypothetical protein